MRLGKLCFKLQGKISQKNQTFGACLERHAPQKLNFGGNFTPGWDSKKRPFFHKKTFFFRFFLIFSRKGGQIGI